MKYYPADAIIIRAMNYGESHRIFTLFTKEDGKFSAIGRGVKKPKSTMKGHLQLGNRCDLLLYHGKSLDTISQAVAKETYPQIRENPKAYLYASYFMELLNAALPEHEAYEEVFDLTHEVFSALAVIEPQVVARYFEIRLLNYLGYAGDFANCAACGHEIKEGFLSPRFPGIICEECGSGYPVSPPSLYGLKYYQKASIDKLEILKISEEVAKQMSNVTSHMLTYNLDRKIKSLEIIKNL